MLVLNNADILMISGGTVNNNQKCTCAGYVCATHPSAPDTCDPFVAADPTWKANGMGECQTAFTNAVTDCISKNAGRRCYSKDITCTV